MSKDEITHPGIRQKVKAATAKADPYADKLLAAAAGSQWTPWIIVAVILAAVFFGVFMVKW